MNRKNKIFLFLLLFFAAPFLFGGESLIIPSTTPVLNINPSLRPTDEHYLKANNFFKDKKYDEALPEFTASIAIYESSKSTGTRELLAKIYNNRGLTYYRKSRLTDASEDFNRAIQYDPKYNKPYYNMGLVYTDKARYSLAIQQFNKSIELDGNSAAAYFSRGTAYLRRDEYEPALEDFNKSIEIDPAFYYAYNGRGNVYYSRGEEDQALENYSKAIELNPEFPLPYYNSGLIYKHRRDYNKAVEFFSKAIENDPKYSYAYYQRGLVYHRLGKKKNAEEDRKKGRKINPFVDISYYFIIVMKSLVMLAFFSTVVSLFMFYKKLDINDPSVKKYFQLSNKGLLFFPFGAFDKGAVLTDTENKTVLEKKGGLSLAVIIPVCVFLGIMFIRYTRKLPAAVLWMILFFIVLFLVFKVWVYDIIKKSRASAMDVPDMYFYLKEQSQAKIVCSILLDLLFMYTGISIWLNRNTVMFPALMVLLGFVILKLHLKMLIGQIKRDQLEDMEKFGAQDKIIQ